MHFPLYVALGLIGISVTLSISPILSPNTSVSNTSIKKIPPDNAANANMEDWPRPPFIFRWDQSYSLTLVMKEYGNQVDPALGRAVLLELEQIGRLVSELGSPGDPFWPQPMVWEFVKLSFNRSIRPQPQPYITIAEARDVISALSYLTRLYGPVNIARAEVFSGRRLDMWFSLDVR